MISAPIDALTFEQASADLGAALDRATRDCTPVIVTRADGDPAVILSLAEWNNIQENLYINATAANRRWLDDSIAEANRGEFIETVLTEDGRIVPLEAPAELPAEAA